MKHLTFKTVFLLALGSGKRRSEMHAWQNRNITTPIRLVKGVPVPITQLFLQESAGQRGFRQCGPRGYNSPGPNWIDPSSLTGPSVQSVHSATIWTGPQTSGRIRRWFFVSFKKGFHKDISPATISSWIKQTVILCYELSDQEAHTLHQVKAHDVRAFDASKVFQSGVFLRYSLVSLPLKSHNTFTQFYLKGGAWADLELYQLGLVVAAQQIHKWPLD